MLRRVWHMYSLSNTVSYAWYVALSVDTSRSGRLGSWAESILTQSSKKTRGLERIHVRNSTTCVIDGVKVCCVHGTPRHRSIRAGLSLWGLRAGQSETHSSKKTRGTERKHVRNSTACVIDGVKVPGPNRHHARESQNPLVGEASLWSYMTMG